MRGTRPTARLAAIAAVWLICFVLAAGVIANVVHRGLLGADAHAYWLTGHETHLYLRAPQSRDAYLYSPAFAQAIWPPAQLSWVWFRLIWMVAESLAFIWLLAPLGWAWAPPALALTGIEVSQGNIWAFLGVAAVLGLRRPEWWALPLLTKVSVGLGPVWFAARREWRNLGRSLWLAALIAAASVIAAPHQWSDWLRFLHHEGNSDPWVLVRAAAAVVLAAAAGLRRQAWLLPPAMLLATPVIHGLGFISLLAAEPRIIALTRQRQPESTAKIVAEP